MQHAFKKQNDNNTTCLNPKSENYYSAEDSSTFPYAIHANSGTVK